MAEEEAKKKPARAPKAAAGEAAPKEAAGKKAAAPKPKAAPKKEAGGEAPSKEAAPEGKEAPEKKKVKRPKPPRVKLVPVTERRAAYLAARAKAPRPASPPKSGKTIKVTQIGSPIGRQDYQHATLKGLGLNRRHRSRVLEDTPAVRGMIARVHHLVVVEIAADRT